MSIIESGIDDALIIDLMIDIQMGVMLLIMIGFVLAAGVFSQAESSLGDYGSVDSIMDRAIATQEDLKREAYEGNSFDIGTFDPSLTGILSKAPVAIFAGLFRPTILDVKNGLMLISAFENTALIIFLFYMVFTIGPVGFAETYSTFTFSPLPTSTSQKSLSSFSILLIHSCHFSAFIVKLIKPGPATSI